MKHLAAVAALVVMLVPIAAAQQNVSGKWTGTFSVTGPDGSHDDTIELNLTQKGKELTGTVGPNAEKQWPVAKGLVDGNKLTFEVQSDGPLVKFTLTLVDGRLKGEGLAEHEGEKMTAKIDAGRAK